MTRSDCYWTLANTHLERSHSNTYSKREVKTLIHSLIIQHFSHIFHYFMHDDLFRASWFLVSFVLVWTNTTEVNKPSLYTKVYILKKKIWLYWQTVHLPFIIYWCDRSCRFQEISDMTSSLDNLKLCHNLYMFDRTELSKPPLKFMFQVPATTDLCIVLTMEYSVPSLVHIHSRKHTAVVVHLFRSVQVYIVSDTSW